MKNNLEIFLFIDALGWDLVESTHFLEKLLPERKPADMQFGYSCSAIPTLLSGKRPADHGHLSLFRFAPDQSPFTGLGKLEKWFKPASFWNRGRVRNWLSRAVKRYYGFTGYFQLYQMPLNKIGMMDYCEKKDLFRSGGMAPFDNLSDILDRSGLKYHISDWHLNDDSNFREGQLAVERGCQFLFLYTAELDGLLHNHVRDPEVIRAKLNRYEEKITGLIRACRSRGADFHFTVISDHGMTPLTRTVDLMSAVERTGLTFGKDYGACYDSTMFRVTFLSPGTREKILKTLEPFSVCGHWLSAEEEREYGIYREDRCFGDAIFLLNPGIQVVPSDMGKTALNGMHGFAPEDRYSTAAILSNTPIPDAVCRVADYFDLMKERIQALAEENA